MTAHIVPLRPDIYLPLRFELPPADAAQARADYRLATAILQFAQAARNEIHQRGEGLSADHRSKLVAMSFLAKLVP